MISMFLRALPFQEIFQTEVEFDLFDERLENAVSTFQIIHLKLFSVWLFCKDKVSSVVSRPVVVSTSVCKYFQGYYLFFVLNSDKHAVVCQVKIFEYFFA